MAELRAALSAAEGAARVAAWARGAAERRAEAAESAAAAAKGGLPALVVTAAADSLEQPSASGADTKVPAAARRAASLAMPVDDAHTSTDVTMAEGAALQQHKAGDGAAGGSGGSSDAAGLAEARQCIAELQRQLEAANAELEERQVSCCPLHDQAVPQRL